MVTGDKRLAGVTGLIDGAALAGRDVVVAWIARAIEDNAAINKESDIGAQLDGAGKKRGGRAIGLEFDGLAGGALIESGLDASGVEVSFVASGEFDGKFGGQDGAGRRNDRFGYRASVLSVETEKGESQSTAETQRRGEKRGR
jgi:hypothetical protein